MKILQMIPAFYPAMAYGGTVNVAYNMSKELAKRGHEITVYTSDALDKDSRHGQKVDIVDGMKVFYFKNVSNTLAWNRFVVNPGIISCLSKDINNFDIIHLHGFRNFQNIFAFHLANKNKVPYLIQAHGSALRIIQRQSLKKLYDAVWGYRLLENASKLIAVSNVEVEQYIQMGADQKKIAVIPNGLDINKLNSQKKHGEFRKKLNISNERLILFLGRIHQRKGVDFLIRSFGRVLENENNAILVVVGPDDGYKRELERIIEELGIGNRVKFVDYISNVSEAYTDADVLIYPAIYEIFGLVPFEAIICGTPVIVADDCGCGEIVKKADCGYLVRYGDVECLKNQIIYVLNNPDEAKKKVLQGQRYIYENLTWDKIVTKVEEVYEDCIL
ncbi:MAG: glycosyltransferase family 4 protein [Thermoanaerobacterales bacterium]|nr:glycosyltransferase family 4 protein [Thermoanaerobacterales bacterium]